VTLAEVSVSAATGYALSRLKFPGRKGFLGLTLVLHAFPSVTLLIAIFFILRALRLYDTMPGVIMVKVALDLPFGIWIMKGFFDTVSWDIEMSALIDGCSRIRTWIQIVLPLIRPGIAALSIFCFLSGWSEFLLPYIFTTRFDNWTLSVLLRNLIGDFRFVDYGLVTAVGLFYMVPVLIFYAFTQQYLLSIYTGGVKGGA
jgi:inositol-phosphate transport system permease protein